MQKKIFAVEDHFQLKGRYLVVVRINEKGSPQSVRIGTLVIIVKPNREEIKTEFGGSDMFGPPNSEILSISTNNTNSI